MSTPLRQLSILHLTDLHFGSNHAFQPPLPPDGHPAVARGWPTLLQSLMRDWQGGTFVDRGLLRTEQGNASPSPNTRTILALTGDFTQIAQDTEFDDAAEFVKQCSTATIMGRQLTPEDIFIVPGNHDLLWESKTPTGRWLPYSNFYANSRNVQVDPRHPEALTKIIDCSSEGLIVAEINSCAYIQRGVENRGQVDYGAIGNLKKRLDEIDQKARDNSIKVALLHHHPVILPGLAESEEGYSAVVNSDRLLERLRDYGFHLVLHGHKHIPFTFWYDAKCAWIANRANPLMIAAGGTVGSTAMVRRSGATNTYNLITIKWDPVLTRVRIHVETRGLRRYRADHSELDPEDWHWETLDIADRDINLPRGETAKGGTTYLPSPQEAEELERPRDRASRLTRRNFPALEILPSLDPEQAYEARVRIEGQIGKPGYEPPDKVEWWAGPNLKSAFVVTRTEDPSFGARFVYWAPVLIQARLHWDKHEPATTHIFASIPTK